MVASRFSLVRIEPSSWKQFSCWETIISLVKALLLFMPLYEVSKQDLSLRESSIRGWSYRLVSEGSLFPAEAWRLSKSLQKLLFSRFFFPTVGFSDAWRLWISLRIRLPKY